MNRELAKKLFSELDNLLKDFGEKNGCNITLASKKFDDVGIYGKVEMKLNSINGLDTEKLEFEQNCFMYGLNKEDYKKKVKINSKVFEIIGFNGKASKNCISIKEISTGKMYKTSLDVIKRTINENN